MFGHFSFSFLHILCSSCFLSFVTLDHLVGLTNLEFVVVIVIICLENVVCLVFYSLNWKLVLFIIMAFCFLVFFSCCSSSLLASSWFLLCC